jgi:catechol 2,3-dioxygenase-like lactoylglutathione lyase family enzyme
MILGIHHIAVHTQHFERLRAFYQEAFGFKPNGPERSWRDSAELDNVIGVPGSASRVQLLKAGTCYLELFEYSSPKSDRTSPLRPFDYGYTHFCVSVTDIEAEYERLKQLGMTFAHSHPINLGEIVAIYGKDPDGNIIELTEAAPSMPFALDQLTGRPPSPTRQ